MSTFGAPGAPKVWLDLANSPHPLLFAPIVRRLEAEGATVAITARDHAQTLELACERWHEVTTIGLASPPGRIAKAGAIAGRLRDLRGWARANRPDVALSYNSYAQILAARSLGIPAVTGMDYEHQPANHVAFRGAARILLPDAVPAGVRRQGATPGKVIRHPGLKEELYLADFEPAAGVLAACGVPAGAGLLAVARTAPAGAAYHRGENPLFPAALRALASRGDATIVVLARLPEQRTAVEALRLPGVHLPASAVDTRSLLLEADLFLGAGGTMTREAALLGVPTYSMFAGRPPAVDLALEARGLLTRLGSVEQLMSADPATSPRRTDRLNEIRTHGQLIEDAFVGATMDASA